MSTLSREEADAAKFTEEAAKHLLEAVRWGDSGPCCPNCGGRNIADIKGREQRRCRTCRKFFTVTSGTIFDRHKLTYDQLAQALIWFESYHPHGITMRLAERLGVTYKVALVLRMKMIEGNLRGDMWGGVSILGRWYWQGFNLFRAVDGEIYRYAKDGSRRLAG
jgi:transposase-like protein